MDNVLKRKIELNVFVAFLLLGDYMFLGNIFKKLHSLEIYKRKALVFVEISLKDKRNTISQFKGIVWDSVYYVL